MELQIEQAQLLTIEAMRRNARVDEDADEDANLMECAAAAEKTVLDYCHTSWEEVLDTYGQVPAVMYKAMLAVAVGMYDSPAGSDGRQTYVAPFGVLASLEHYKRLTNREV